MSDQWYYSQNGQQQGPVSAADLKRRAQQGELLATDLVWKEGMADWIAAAKLNGLQFAPPAPPPLPSSSPESFPPEIAVENPGFPVVESAPADVGFAVDDGVAPDTRVNSSRSEHSYRRHGGQAGGFHLQRILIAVAAGLGMLGTFLPWASFAVMGQGGSISGTQTTAGWVCLILFVPAVVMIFLGEYSHPLKLGFRLGAIIPAGIAGLIAIANLIDFKSAQDRMSAANPFGKMVSNAISLGPGLFVILVAAIGVVLIGCLIGETKPRRSYQR